MADDQEIILVPLTSPEVGVVHMRIERVKKSSLSQDSIHHVAGGPYKGIIVSKVTAKRPLDKVADTEKVYTAYIIDTKNAAQDMRREKRDMRFWFEPQTKIRPEIPKAITETFFKELMNPHEFPKDHIHYVIRLLTLVKQYSAVLMLEVSLRFLRDDEADEGEVFERDVTEGGTGQLPPNTSGQDDMIRLADGTVVSKHGTVRSAGPNALKLQGGTVQRRDYRANGDSKGQDDNLTQHGFHEVEGGQISGAHKGTKVKRTLTLRGKEVVYAARRQNVLNTLEDAYPNVLSVEDIAILCELKPIDVEQVMEELGTKSLIKAVDKKRFIRMPPERKLVIPQNRSSKYGTIDKIQEEKKKHEFKMVAHVPTLPDKEQPTIAVVTLLFCEKLAVDSMMDTKTTYIRVKKGEGEGQVYTVGMIGKHRLVSTKLSRIGHKQEAMVAAGNNVTRLLGTFSKLEHVLLVGVGGGVACLNDDERHVRLGDVVVSKGSAPKKPVYIHCLEAAGDPPKFKVQSWGPKDKVISDIVGKLYESFTGGVFLGSTWDMHMAEATLELKSGDTRFERPAADTNKPYKVRGGQEIEFEPPQSPIGSPRAVRGEAPMMHMGVIGAGKMFPKEDDLRDQFVDEFNLRCVDTGFQAVMDSIEGNRKDSFAIIRGIADYQDGTHRRDWQGYAALAAAAVMKAVVLQIPSEDVDSDDDN